MSIASNIAGVGNYASIGWTVETSTGYTSSGPTITPVVGHSFYGSDFLGLSRYGKPTNTDVAQLTQQLQQLISKGPKPYTLTQDLVDKVLRDNVQNWNFFYPNGTSPKPRPWRSIPGIVNYLMPTITEDGRLTFDRDEEPPHNWQYIHYLVDWFNYLVQLYSDQPYIVLIDHLKRLGKGWKTPQSGSLWHVIHTGDVNFAKVTSWVKQIPLLDQFLSTFGLSVDTLEQYAQTYLQTGGSSTVDTGLPTGTPPSGDGSYNPDNPAGLPSNQNKSFMQNPMLLAAAAGGGTYLATKKPLYAIIAAGLVYYFTNQQQSTPTPGASATPSVATMRSWLINWAKQVGSPAEVETVIPTFQQMTDSEIGYVYDYIANYMTQGKSVDPASVLMQQINAISAKYNIFT